MGYPAKTLSDTELLSVIRDLLEHLTEDVHDLASRVAAIEARTARVDGLLTQHAPLLARFASPAAALVATRRARKEARNG